LDEFVCSVASAAVVPKAPRHLARGALVGSLAGVRGRADDGRVRPL